MIGGIVGQSYNIVSSNINNAYNIGNIETENKTSQRIGSIIGMPSFVTLSNCYYLSGTYEVGIGENIESDSVKKLETINDFPSVLSIVNIENVFKEDTNNINNGYPILEWQ